MKKGQCSAELEHSEQDGQVVEGEIGEVPSPDNGVFQNQGNKFTFYSQYS